MTTTKYGSWARIFHTTEPRDELCENLAHGPDGAGVINLGMLWQLDQTNRPAVLAALTKGLTR